jgi:hypothetical protein
MPEQPGETRSTTCEIANTSVRDASPSVVCAADIKFILILTLAIGFLSSIPYIVGHLAKFPGSAFTDVLEYEMDANNYLAYARQAASGAWLFHNPMTGEPHGDVFFNLEWLAIGKIALFFHLPLGIATNVLRLAFIPVLIFGVYWLLSFAIENTLLRRIALVAVMTGGGFGWLVLLRVPQILHLPINSWYFFDLRGGLFPFFWTSKISHFLIAESFVLLGLCFFLRGEQNLRVSSYAVAGLFYLLTGACRPYDMLYLCGATGLYACVTFWKSPARITMFFFRIIPVLLCAPLFGYYLWIFKVHPVFRWWSLPGRLAPAPWALACSYGLSFFLFCFAARRLRSSRLRPVGTLMVCSLATSVVIVYSHGLISYPMQYATDIIIPLSMLGFTGLEKKFVGWSPGSRRTRLAVVAILAVNSLTSLGLTAQAARFALKGNYRIDQGLLDAYSWIDHHSQSNDLVLADLENSNRMPRYIHNRMFCGYYNTVKFDEKKMAVDRFLAPDTPNPFREQLLRQHAIRYVLLNKDEARLLTGIGNTPFLNEVFANGSAVVYTFTTP